MRFHFAPICLLPLFLATCQSTSSLPREVSISPNLRANPGATAPRIAKRNRLAPPVDPALAQAPHSDVDGRFSEALVPESAFSDPTQAAFRKRNRVFEAKVGKGKTAFTWIIDPDAGNYLDIVSIKHGSAIIRPMHGANIEGPGKTPTVNKAEIDEGALVLHYADGLTGTLTAIGRSLRYELVRDSGPRRGFIELRMGGVLATKSASETSVFRVPYFDIASVAAVNLRRGGVNYLTGWFDTGFSNASVLNGQYPGSKGEDDAVNFAQQARYLIANNGQRQPIRERIWLSWSPELTDVLPSMDRPISKERDTFSELYYLSYNSTPFREATANIQAIAAMGVENLHVWMHHWQKDGFDTGYPNAVMPPRQKWGGADGMLALRKAIGDAGYGLALHHNWMFNSVKLPGKSLLNGKGQPLTVKTGGEFLKSSAALEMVDAVESNFHEAFDTRGTHSDSLTASIPHVDLDSKTQGWGLIRTQLSNLTGVLQRLRAIHGTPVTSEGSLGGGNVTWAGLSDVMPGSLFIATQPKGLDRSGKYVEVIPHFALGRLHDISVRAGLGPPTRFVMPTRPTLSRSYASADRDLMQTLTALYGNAGYFWWYARSRPGNCAREWWSNQGLLVELSQAGREVASIKYVDDRNREMDLSEWIESKNGLNIGDVRLHVTWVNGDELWANVTESEWRPKGNALTIAPFGHEAIASGVRAGIVRVGKSDIQYLESPTRRFLDGRGKLATAIGISTDGAVGLERIAADGSAGWHVFPIGEYALEIPGKGREVTVSWSKILLDETVVGTSGYELVWIDAAGAELGSEMLDGSALELSPEDFLDRGATSVRILTGE